MSPSDAGLWSMIPFLPVPMDLAELPVPWLLSAVEERFGSRVSICTEAIFVDISCPFRPEAMSCCVLEHFVRLGAVAHPLSRQEGDLGLPRCRNFVSIKCRLRCDTGPALRPGDSSGGENVSRPGLRSGEPCGFRSNARVCKFQAADHSVKRTRAVLAWLRQCCRFSPCSNCGSRKEPTSHPDSVSKSFLHVGNVVVRRPGHCPRTPSRW